MTLAQASPTTETAIVLAHGSGQLKPLTLRSIVTSWEIEPVVVLLLAASIAIYLYGVHTLRRRGITWSRWHTASWIAGLGTVFLATSSVLAVYDTALFSVHTVQHLLLQMLAPIPLALAAPVTLALRTLPPPHRRRLIGILHSRPVGFITRPLITYALFVISPFALYYSSLFEQTLRHPWIHNLSHVHFLIVGSLLYSAIIGIDPLPNKMTPLPRFGLVLGMGPMHVLLGIPLMMSNTPLAADYYSSLPREWGPSVIADQQRGGALLWIFGDVTILALLPALLTQWVRSDQREARRVDRDLDRRGVESLPIQWDRPDPPGTRTAMNEEPDNDPRDRPPPGSEPGEGGA